MDSSPRSFSFISAKVRIPVHTATKWQKPMGYMTIGAAQLRSAIKIAPKSRLLCVNRSPMWCGFRVGARAIQYGVNIAYYRNPIKTELKLFL